MKRTWLVAALLMLTALVVSACAGSSGNSLRGHLEPGGATLRLVRVSSGLALSNHMKFEVGKVSVSRRQAPILVLAQMIDELPKPPKGVRFCPVDFGVEYRLTFLGSGGFSRSYEFDPGGCEVLYLGPQRQRAWQLPDDNRFWAALGGALGRPGATSATFAGTLPAG